MNNNIKTITIAGVALVVGLLAGYVFFGGTPAHDHSMSGSTSDAAASSTDIYTCSMHPQIRQNEPGDCAICGMDLIILEENSSSDPLVLEMTAEAVKLANIQTTMLGSVSRAGGEKFQLSGKIQADERRVSSLVTHLPGRIEQLYVTFTGEQVRKGQKLAEIYSPELVAAQQELLEAKQLQDLNPALLEAARNKLRYWKIGAETIAKIEAEGSIQETFTLYASAAGIVTNRRVAVGDYLRAGSPLFEVMDLRQIWALFDVYEEQLAEIKLGDIIEFTTPALSGRNFRAGVNFIDPFINPTTRVATVRLEVSNTNGLLKPEMLVYGSVQQKEQTASQLLVPKSAVMWTGIRSVVYVKIPEQTVPSFQFREIEIGAGQGDSYPVLAGLKAGEEVVTNGSFTIDAAAQLNNQASMMNQDVAIKDEQLIDFLPDFTEETPVAFKQQLATVVQAYLRLKDALVVTDPAQANTHATEVLTSLQEVDMVLLNGDAHVYWMEQEKAMKAHAELLQSATEVEAQRQQFDFLSQALIDAIKVFGIAEDTFYVQFCPMAFDNEGASWLSSEEQIANPYFGDKMLRCGLVDETIDKGFKNPKLVD